MTRHDALRLDRSLAQGMAWTGGIRWATMLLTWGLTMVTARLLAPADYGVMGMAMVYIGFAQLVSDVGLNATIIQAPSLSEALAARLGGAAVMLAVAVASISLALAPLLAGFFNEPAVYGLIIALSLTFVPRGVQVLRRAMLARALRFKSIAFIEAGEAIVGAGVAVVGAVLRLGPWALALGLLSGVLFSTIAYVIVYPHRLEWPRHLVQLEGRLRFSTQVLGGQVAWYSYIVADMVIVGRMLGSAALGAYTLAWVIAGVAVERIAALTGKVTPSIFAAAQHNHALLRRYVYAITEGLALVTLPICIGVALTADSIVRVVLGDAWLPTVAPMRLLAFYAATRCIAVVLPQVVVYTGRARISMQYNALALLVLVPLFIIGARTAGTIGVALVWLLMFPTLTMATYMRELRRSIDLSLREYGAALRPALVATVVMTAVVATVRVTWPPGAAPTLELATAVGLGAAAYGLTVYLRYRDRVTALLGLLRGDAGVAPGEESRKTPNAPERETARGRLLLISFHYPPDPAIGSLRWQKFSKHAAARGWSLDVIMRDESGIAAPDFERLKDLPPSVRRFAVPTREFWFDTLERRAAKLYRRFRPHTVATDSVRTATLTAPRSGRDFLRAYFAVVAYWRMHRWATQAARLALRLAKSGEYSAVIACGPPFDACIAARRVAARLKIPLVLDFRDPWSSPQRVPEAMASPVTLALHARAERRCVRAAALVVANTTPVGNDLRARYPGANIIDVPNGYDDEVLPVVRERKRFIIAYAGTIYLDRNPSTLFAAVKRVITTLGLTPDQIGIEFLGTVEHTGGTTLEERAREAGLARYVTIHPARSRSAALEFLAGASMLVLLNQDSDKVIPGKIYEYMLFDAWVLVLAEPWSATARLLEGSAADVISNADVEGITRIVARHYLEFTRGARPEPIAVDERFSRAARAAAFFGAMDRVLQTDVAVEPEREPEPQAVLTLH